MADSSSVLKTSTFVHNYKKPFNVLKKIKRNRWRILRRKRSKLKYKLQRKKLRINKQTEELSDTISFVNITDIEMELAHSQTSGYVPPIREVASWQNQHQVAYWKSRAIALEYENHMLHKLVENFHKKQIRDYEEYTKVHDQMLENRFEETQGRPRDGEMQTEKQSQNSRKKSTDVPEEHCKPPSNEEARLQKQKQMRSLYGEMAPKICGMEIATQLNYDQYIEKHNPSFWPNIPIRLQFTT